MATVREMKNLLSKVEITISEDDIRDAIEIVQKGETLKAGETIEDKLLNNASNINFKKLLIIIVKRRQELLNRYKSQKVSNLLEEMNEKQLEKAIKFAKAYIKPEEFVKVVTLDYTSEGEPPIRRMIDSKTVVYGQKIEEKNKLYEKIKDTLPDLEVVMFMELFKNILEDDNLAKLEFKEQVNDFMIQENIDSKTIDTFWKSIPKAESDEEVKNICAVIDKKKFNERMRDLIQIWGPYINAEKCILFYGCCIGNELEKRKTIRSKRDDFLEKHGRFIKRYS